jgi:nitroreductase
MKNELIEQSLGWRYAVKKFDTDKKISNEDWSTLTSSLVLAPSSYGIQPWKFLVVETPKVRESLREVSWGQSQVTDAARFVVFASKEKVSPDDVQKYLEKISSTRGVSVETLSGFKDMLHNNVVSMEAARTLAWTQRQAYIAMGFLLETAAILKIDATPMEGLDAQVYDKILGLEGTGYKAVAAVALGYRHKEDGSQNLKKVRFDSSDILKYL